MSAEASGVPVSPRRILLAEDDPLSAHTLRLALTVDGHEVDVAETGEEALSLFEKKQYELVITDFKLPGMDGMELAEAIKQRIPSTRIILVTAYAGNLPQAGPISNVDVLLTKPVSVRELQGAMQKVFPP